MQGTALTVDQICDALQAKQGIVTTPRQRDLIRYLESRGFLFLAHFEPNNIEESAFALIEREAKGASKQ